MAYTGGVCGAFQAESKYGCAHTGADWEKLSDDASEAVCRTLCGQAALAASLCCWFKSGTGCYQKAGAAVSNDPDDIGSKSAMCYAPSTGASST